MAIRQRVKMCASTSDIIHNLPAFFLYSQYIIHDLPAFNHGNLKGTVSPAMRIALNKYLIIKPVFVEVVDEEFERRYLASSKNAAAGRGTRWQLAD